MAPKVTMEEIAREAGVSASTVSRVMNSPDRVKRETRDRIYESMRKLNYLPHGARKDPSTLANIIAIFAPNLLLDSVTELVRAIEQELSRTNFDLLLVNMRGERDFGRFITAHSHLRKKIDGAVVFSADLSEQAAKFMRAADIPVVLMQERSSVVRSVSNNNFLGGMDATEHLLRCGYRRIAFVGWQPSDGHVIDRLSGYRAALQRAGLPFREEDIAYGTLDSGGGFEATRILLANSKPDAIFYATDVMAVGGIRWLRRSGVSVPDEIGVMGFDDLAVAEALDLTTMRQFFDSKARMVVQYLVPRVTGEIREDRVEELQVTPRVVERGTTRRPME
ncbi:MAG: LacI family DNA-binding transcriptional regulator [Spirochaetaceae bacterium]